ncbi:hypothetical protein AJ79_04407 [Helicocarpus griseus UAMH5409]|uniref:CENP-V/GFA domain-containing protein n=1 Tax=Helicocarpus griseus UAMH5409 TaxID=1447875 RepID=A0A2B7XUR5_9EURO|nr:hypothetical protein AJ79_04407 [Helicocarpus griseus UAMH5409]
MASLPREPFSLQGGCLCRSVRYQITFPKFDERQILNPNHPPDQPDIRAPLVCFDHCNDCRKASGTPVQTWIICPQEYIRFTLLRRSAGAESPTVDMSGNQLVHPNSASEETYLTHYSSSKSVWRTFCCRCGTNISFVAYEEAGSETLMDLLLGTLDRESLELVGMPEHHIWWDLGIGWVKKLTAEGDGSASGNALPRHPKGDIYQLA